MKQTTFAGYNPHYGLLWFIMVYYGLLWFIMVYYGLLWFIIPLSYYHPVIIPFSSHDYPIFVLLLSHCPPVN